MTKKILICKKELERIKNARGKLTAKIIVEEAEDENNPLHNYFNWDDNEAGVKWRLHQARCLVNIIKYDLITSKGKKKEVFAFEIIKTDNDKEYKFAHEILSNQKWKNQILQYAIKEISYWRKKYEVYSEFGLLVREIKKIERRFLKDGNKRKRKDSSYSTGKKGNKN